MPGSYSYRNLRLQSQGSHATLIRILGKSGQDKYGLSIGVFRITGQAFHDPRVGIFGLGPFDYGLNVELTKYGS